MHIHNMLSLISNVCFLTLDVDEDEWNFLSTVEVSLMSFIQQIQYLRIFKWNAQKCWYIALTVGISCCKLWISNVIV